jgi:hypothetical protein
MVFVEVVVVEVVTFCDGVNEFRPGVRVVENQGPDEIHNHAAWFD